MHRDFSLAEYAGYTWNPAEDPEFKSDELVGRIQFYVGGDREPKFSISIHEYLMTAGDEFVGGIMCRMMESLVATLQEGATISALPAGIERD